MIQAGFGKTWHCYIVTDLCTCTNGLNYFSDETEQDYMWLASELTKCSCMLCASAL